MDLKTILPPLLLGTVAVCGLAVAIRRGLFSPPIPGKDADAGSAPLFIGAFAMFCWMMVAGLIATSMTGLRPGSNPEAAPALTARTQLLAAGLQVGPALLIAWWAWRRAAVPAPAAKTGTLIAQGLGWAVLLLPTVFGVGAAAFAVSELLGHPVDRTAHVMLKMIVGPGSDTATRWMLITAAVAAAPALEEVCYRGLLQPAVARTLRSNVGAVAITSVLFTVMHAPVIPADSLWPALLQLLVLAVVLGMIAARTGSVISSIVVHAVFNAVSIAVAVWSLAK